MKHFFALLALSSIVFCLPLHRRGEETGPDFYVLTCKSQSITVTTLSNTAFITSDPAFTQYGDKSEVVNLNGCSDLTATFNAYVPDEEASPEATPFASNKCTIRGAPDSTDAQLRVVDYEPWYELVNAEGVTVSCEPQEVWFNYTAVMASRAIRIEGR